MHNPISIKGDLSMKAKRNLVMLFTLFCLALIFSGCSSDASNSGTPSAASSETPAKNKKKVVGVLIGDFSAQFHAYIMDGMKVEAKKYPDVQFVYVDGKFDSTVQLGQVENFIAQKVDAIIFVPGDSEGSRPAVDLIAKAGIPLINVNTKVPNADQVAAYAYAGSSSVESGEILMEAMAEVMGGKGNMIELQGWYGHEPQIERHQGIANILKKHPDIKVLAEDSGKWNREEGMKKVENWIQSDLKGKFNAIVAHNDEMAVGAVKALEDAGLLEQVVVGGIDATPDALNMLKAGKLKVTVFQDAFGQGAKGVELAVKVLNGEKLEKEYIIPYKRVKPEEADKYLAIYGKK